MGKHVVPVILGVAAGVTAAAWRNPEDTSLIQEALSSDRKKGYDTQIAVGAPQTSIAHLSAFAVGRISGEISVAGSYDEVRWGPVPNCNVDISMSLPFVAEPIVKLSDLSVTVGTPDATGSYPVHVAVDGNVDVLNPRSKLDSSEVEHSGDDWGQVCSPENYDKLINSMWEIGGLATNTAAECLANSVTTQYVTDMAGNPIESDPSREIHRIYEEDLKVALQALYPGGVVTVEWPQPEAGYDITQTDTYRALSDAIERAEADDDRYLINADPVLACQFSSLALDVSTMGAEG